MKTIAYWTDPEDCDQGMNSDFEVFENNDEFLNWLNKKLVNRPRINVMAFENCREISLKKENVVTKYSIK